MPNLKPKGLKKYPWVGKHKKSPGEKACESYANYKGKHPGTKKKPSDFSK